MSDLSAVGLRVPRYKIKLRVRSFNFLPRQQEVGSPGPAQNALLMRLSPKEKSIPSGSWIRYGNANQTDDTAAEPRN